MGVRAGLGTTMVTAFRAAPNVTVREKALVHAAYSWSRNCRLEAIIGRFLEMLFAREL